jgi:hypothetical protein
VERDDLLQYEVDPEDTSDDCAGRRYFLVVPDGQLCLLPPTLWGFSLVLNDWGQFLVDKFNPIVFDEKAYDHLVMEEPQKVSLRGRIWSRPVNQSRVRVRI